MTAGGKEPVAHMCPSFVNERATEAVPVGSLGVAAGPSPPTPRWSPCRCRCSSAHLLPLPTMAAPLRHHIYGRWARFVPAASKAPL
jgi:hypothetical protein